MARIVVLLSVLRNNLFHLVNICDVVGKGKELTAFLGVVSFANGLRYGFIFVGHFFPKTFSLSLNVIFLYSRHAVANPLFLLR